MKKWTPARRSDLAADSRCSGIEATESLVVNRCASDVERIGRAGGLYPTKWWKERIRSPHRASTGHATSPRA